MQGLRDKMAKTIDATKSHFATIRTGRANPDLLSKIMVDYYGSMTPLQQVASISVPEPMVLMLNVFDKNAVKDVEKAIMTSDLNINPQTDGSIIRLRLPDLTEERRAELVKIVKRQGEDGKIALRNIRRDFIDEIKEQEKAKEISEDDSKKQQDEAQKITDEFNHDIDELIKSKEAEIMMV